MPGFLRRDRATEARRRPASPPGKAPVTGPRDPQPVLHRHAPLALVRRADGRVKAVGQPGTLLGLLPDPDLSDTRLLLRSGDSMILFTDGVTESRSHVDRDFFGEERLGDLIGGLGGLTAAQMAAAVIKAITAFSGGVVSDDTVVLVLRIP